MRSQPQLMLRLQNGRFDAPGISLSKIPDASVHLLLSRKDPACIVVALVESAKLRQ